MKTRLRAYLVASFLLFGASLRADSLLVKTFAGTGSPGSADGPVRTATFKGPNGVAVDAAGTVYVCDIENKTIRKIVPPGEVTTIAGSPGLAGATDGTGSNARFGGPVGIAVDSHGNLFVADNPNCAIRKITPAGVVTTFAGQLGIPGFSDGTGSAARFNFPHEIAIDAGDNLYVADVANHVIRKITPAGQVSTFAGRAGVRGNSDGQGSAATFEFPSSITVDSGGNVWVGGNGTIRRITPGGAVTTIAGAAGAAGYVDGPATSARFGGGPEGLAFDRAGNLVISDPGNAVIRSLSPDLNVTTVAGMAGTTGFTEGIGPAALLNFPLGIAGDSAGRVYFSDSSNNVVRVAIRQNGAPSITLATPGAGTTITNGSPIRVSVSNAVLDCTASTDAVRWQLLVDGSVAATSCRSTVRLTRSLSAGQHELTARLVGADGAPLLLSFDSKVSVNVAPDPLFDLVAIIPGQARVAGAGGAFFRSTEWLTNSSDQPTVVRLAFVPGAGFAAGGISEAVTVTIPAHESVAYRDVLSDPFAATENTSGNVLLSVGRGLAVPLVTSRTFNDTDHGTFGQYIRAVPLSASAAETWIHGLSGDHSSRSNLGIINLSSGEARAIVTLFGADGSRIGDEIPVTVSGYSSLQLGRINVEAGLGDVPLFSARVAAQQGSAPFSVYVSKLDNVTSDPIFITPLAERSEQWIDGVGAVHGIGTVFRTTVVLANRNSVPAQVRVAYTLRSSISPVDEKTVTIPAGASVMYRDVINELFVRPETAGSLAISSDVPVTAWARTYSDREAEGTLGQFIPAFDRTQLFGTTGAILPGLSDNAAFRTNFGAMNVSATDQDIRVEAFAEDGSKVGEESYHVRAGEAIFVGRFLAAIAGRSVDDVYVRITPATAGAIYAWASSVDNTSTDQTFVRPIAAP